eukprot:TRINITY_DN1047_c0_g1_i2.p1 TRINITY_DN1047_c0_g1~~TRINITY_DN1047_c0_g1_i2.p1  ORF type:complete len:151 (-),score=17.67 TRINITY_DN1047_c0_g1_i2:516-968(-)
MVTTKKSLHEVLTTPSEVLKLIKHGADVNAIVSKSSGDTALHVAASQGLLDAAQLLLDHGANFNIQNVDNWTPLHVAARDGKEDVVRLLLSRGAPVNTGDVTPLLLAVSRRHEAVVKVLLEHGASTRCRERHGLVRDESFSVVHWLQPTY